jgi:hypothetical protein
MSVFLSCFHACLDIKGIYLKCVSELTNSPKKGGCLFVPMVKCLYESGVWIISYSISNVKGNWTKKGENDNGGKMQ